jgi:hypothetical protein
MIFMVMRDSPSLKRLYEWKSLCDLCSLNDMQVYSQSTPLLQQLGHGPQHKAHPAGHNNK